MVVPLYALARWWHRQQNNLGQEKLKTVARQRLCEGIGELITGGNMRYLKEATSDQITNKLKIKVNVFHVRVENRIGTVEASTNIVTRNGRCGGGHNTKFTKQGFDPSKFSGGTSNGMVLSLEDEQAMTCCLRELQEMRLPPR